MNENRPEQHEDHRDTGEGQLSAGSRVGVRLADDHVLKGVVVDDYGEIPSSTTELGPNRVIAQARRWAVVGDDGTLVFADTHQITVESGEITTAVTESEEGPGLIDGDGPGESSVQDDPE